MQRHAAIWILGAFKTSPTGAVKMLAGLTPIHLHIWKLVQRSHSRYSTLVDQHANRMVVDDDFMWYHPSKLKKLSSPLIDMWTNRENIGVNIYPYNEFNALGSYLLDRFPECIIKDMVLIQGKNAKERAEARKSRLISLNRDYDRSLGHSKHAVIITDTAVPLLSTGYQAVAAWNIWHKGSCISEDWQARGLAISDDTETFAIASAFSALAS